MNASTFGYELTSSHLVESISQFGLFDDCFVVRADVNTALAINTLKIAVKVNVSTGFISILFKMSGEIPVLADIQLNPKRMTKNAVRGVYSAVYSAVRASLALDYAHISDFLDSVGWFDSDAEGEKVTKAYYKSASVFKTNFSEKLEKALIREGVYCPF